MREYAKLGPTFWTGETGKALRRRGSDAVVVALYLISSPASNMLGLYYQPLLYMAHETGLGIEGARKGLQHCIEVGFCQYDGDTEMVFVKEMAAWQIAEQLKPGDLRCKGIQKDYDSLPDNPFLEAWFERYHEAFHLTSRRTGNREPSLFPELGKQGPSKGPSQAPSKPGAGAGAGAGAGGPPASRVPPTASPRPSKRCPDDFEVPADEWRKLAAECPHVDLEAETRAFRDHTFATAKSDWLATWRNWIRKAGKDAKPPARAAPRQTATDRAVATLDALTGRSNRGPNHDPRPEPPLADVVVVDVAARHVG